MRYRNLDLEVFHYRLAGSLECFQVRVAASSAGEQKLSDAEEASLPSDLRPRLRLLEQRRLSLPEMTHLGEDLAAALFPPRARTLLERSLERLKDDEGLRIRLKLDTYALADLPWEYAYIAQPDTPPDQKGAEGFLVLSRRISLVRYEVLGQAPGTLDPIGTTPLRMVALLANPDDPSYPGLKLEAEKENISRALEHVPGIRVEFYEDATVEKLLDALAHEAHVFHFAGHGQFEGDLGTVYGSLEGAGFIVLLGPDRRAAPFPAQRLALNLAARGVRLAVLGACEGGRRDGRNAWTGVTPALMRAGIPAVVGMQYTIRDDNAVAFSRQFYIALAEGEPVDAAVTDGRLAIFDRGDSAERDWGVPVLYLRAEEGVLFPKVVNGQPVAPYPVRVYQSLRNNISLIASLFALLGMSVAQLLNLRPSDQSLFSFLLFTALALAVVVYCVVIVSARKRVERAWESVREPVYSKRARLSAAAGMILTPAIYLVLALFLQIPNTWPILVQVGAESRDANTLIRNLPSQSLLTIRQDEPKVRVLSYVDRFFSPSPTIHRIAIVNRSAVRSPALILRLTLQVPPGRTLPPARVLMGAVASPTDGAWLRYDPFCRDHPGEPGWCFDEPNDTTDWRTPTVRLPSIRPRDSLEVYLELALSKGEPVLTIPAALDLSEAAKGEFHVTLHRSVDLNSRVSRR